MQQSTNSGDVDTTINLRRDSNDYHTAIVVDASIYLRCDNDCHNQPTVAIIRTTINQRRRSYIQQSTNGGKHTTINLMRRYEVQQSTIAVIIHDATINYWRPRYVSQMQQSTIGGHHTQMQRSTIGGHHIRITYHRCNSQPSGYEV